MRTLTKPPIHRPKPPPIYQPKLATAIVPVVESTRLSNIPTELRTLPQWVLYRKVQRDGRTTKIPYQTNGQLASTTDASTWTTFDEVVAAIPSGKFDGAGLVFTFDDPYAGIDLDHAIDADGTILPWARGIVDLFPDAYAERSQSGAGIHLIVRAKLPAEFPHKRIGMGDGTGAIEVYDVGRYFVTTGDVLRPGGTAIIGEVNIVALLARVFKPPLPQRKPSTPRGGTEGFQGTDDDLIKRAMNAKNGASFGRLWSGDTSAYNGDDSAADQALINHLAFWTKDPERIDRLFRRSGLMRPKWDRQDYRDATIGKALESCTATYGEKPDAPDVPDFMPFPTGELPDAIAAFVREQADALGCDEAAIAPLLLVALASAIGNTRQLRIKQGWFVPAILWVMLVAITGSKKSPILNAAMQFVMERQRKLHQEYKQQLAEFEMALAAWNALLKDQRLAEKPQKPRYPHVYVDDSTIEGLAAILEHAVRGVILIRDELSGWLRGFNRYSNGSGEEQQYLPLYNGHSLKIDRKNAEQPTIYIPRASVSIVGSIQPDVLREAFTPDRYANGLAPRFTPTFPREKDGPGWTEREVNPATLATVQTIFDELYDLHLDNGQPGCVRLHPDAKALFAAFVDATKIERLALGDTPLAGAWSKFEEIPARLSLILQLTSDAATGQQPPPTEFVFAETMQHALVITHWMMHEAKRVYAMLGHQADADPQEQLVDLIREKGGRVTTRELRAASNRHRGAGIAEAALESLVAAKMGRWEFTPTAGRPVSHFALLE